MDEKSFDYIIENYGDLAEETVKYDRKFIIELMNSIDLEQNVEENKKVIDEKISEYANKQAKYGLSEKDVEFFEKVIPYKELILISSKSNRDSVESLLKNPKNVETIKEYNIPLELFSSYNVTGFFEKFGINTIMEFDKENGNIFSKNNFELAKKIYEAYMHYAANIHDNRQTISTKNMNLETYEIDYSNYDYEREYTQEEFEESFRRMLVYGPSNYEYKDFIIDYSEVQGKFKENHPELYLSDNFPKELSDRFYGGKLTFNDFKLISNDEILANEFESKEKQLGFRKILNGISYSQNKIDRIFEVAKHYGNYVTIVYDFIDEETPFDELLPILKEKIEQEIINGNAFYGPDVPEFMKEKYPEIFLDENTPEELKLAYYGNYISSDENYENHSSLNYSFSIDFIKEHPEYFSYLEGKSLNLVRDPYVKKLSKFFSNEEILELVGIDSESLKIISNQSEEKVEKFARYLKEKPQQFASNEMILLEGYTEEELIEIKSDKELTDQKLIDGRKLFESKKEKFRNLIIETPELVIYYPEEKIEEFNFSEYKELLKMSKFTVSDNYRRDVANQIVMTMYGLLGYGESKDILKLPEIEESELEEVIQRTGRAFSEIYEENYSLKGNLKVTNTLFNKFVPMLPGKKGTLDVYRTLNQKLEEGFEGNLEDLLKQCLEENNCEYDEKKLSNISRSAIAVSVSEKMELLSEKLSNNISLINETTPNKKMMRDILSNYIRKSLLEDEKIDVEKISENLQKEFSRTKEDGTSFYSPHITEHLSDLIEIAQKINLDVDIGKKVNTSVVGILKDEKQKIGKGWIRKLLSVPDKVKGKEKEELEQRLYGENSTEKIPAEKTLELIDKSEEGIEKAYILLKELELPSVFTYEKGEKMFAGLSMPYSENFKNFFIQNKTEILKKPEYYTKFQRMHSDFDRIISDPNINNRFQAGRYTLDELVDELDNIVYENVGSGEYELEYRARKAGLEKIYFPQAQRVFKEMQEREYQTVPPVDYNGKTYRGRILRIDDPLHLTVGNITTCCQRFGDAQPGEPSMIHSATEVNGSVFIVEEVDRYGNVIKPVAQSWTWRNGDRICFDNVEIPDTIKGELRQKGAYDEIFKVYQETAKKMIYIDTKNLDKMLESGKITKEQYDILVIKEVTVGTGCDDLLKNISQDERYSLEEGSSVSPIEAQKRYVGAHEATPWIDSKKQLILPKNETLGENTTSHVISNLSMMKYGRVREVVRRTNKNIHQDIVSRMKKMNEEAGTLETSVLSKTQNDRIEYLNMDDESSVGKDIGVSFSENDDWYILTIEDDRNITVVDSLITNGKNENSTQSPIDRELAKLEYLKEITQLILISDEKGKPLVLDPKREGKYINLQEFESKGIIEISDNNISLKDGQKVEEILREVEERIEKKKDDRLIGNFEEEER